MLGTPKGALRTSMGCVVCVGGLGCVFLASAVRASQHHNLLLVFFVLCHLLLRWVSRCVVCVHFRTKVILVCVWRHTDTHTRVLVINYVWCVYMCMCVFSEKAKKMAPADSKTPHPLLSPPWFVWGGRSAGLEMAKLVWGRKNEGRGMGEGCCFGFWLPIAWWKKNIST